jgi:hypothetical protein
VVTSSQTNKLQTRQFTIITKSKPTTLLYSQSLLPKNCMGFSRPRLSIRHNRPIIPLTHGIHNPLNPIKHLHLIRFGAVHCIERKRLGAAVVPHIDRFEATAVSVAIDDVDGAFVGGVFDVEDAVGGVMEFAGVEGADSEEDANVGREGVGVVHCFIRSEYYFYYGSFLELVCGAGRARPSSWFNQRFCLQSAGARSKRVGRWCLVIFKYWYPGIF